MGVYICKKKKSLLLISPQGIQGSDDTRRQRLSLCTLRFGVTDLAAIPYLGVGDPEEITDVPRHISSQHIITGHRLVPIRLCFFICLFTRSFTV